MTAPSPVKKDRREIVMGASLASWQALSPTSDVFAWERHQTSTSFCLGEDLPVGLCFIHAEALGDGRDLAVHARVELLLVGDPHPESLADVELGGMNDFARFFSIPSE